MQTCSVNDIAARCVEKHVAVQLIIRLSVSCSVEKLRGFSRLAKVENQNDIPS
jgi:hypothetical protein